jgi:osmotically-inducible protein OsmY
VKKIKITGLALVVSASLILQSCAGLLIGAGVGAASAAYDKRTLGTQLDDKTLASRISTALSNDKSIEDLTSVSVQVFNRTALLTGQAPSQELIKQIERHVEKIANIKKIHNQVRLGSPLPASAVANDLWLVSKVKTILIANKQIDGLNINIAVENAELFLMGIISQKDAAIVVEIARNIRGVKQVVKAFDYQ